jgi:hypothetical protein
MHNDAAVCVVARVLRGKGMIFKPTGCGVAQLRSRVPGVP